MSIKTNRKIQLSLLVVGQIILSLVAIWYTKTQRPLVFNVLAVLLSVQIIQECILISSVVEHFKQPIITNAPVLKGFIANYYPQVMAGLCFIISIGLMMIVNRVTQMAVLFTLLLPVSISTTLNAFVLILKDMYRTIKLMFSKMKK